MSESTKGDLEIVNDLGLHARAAAKLVRVANDFDADVFVGHAGREVNGKSILGVLMLACAKGSTISVRCEGKQAMAAYRAIGDLVRDGFGER
ncbi:HPr family phosphocarrier protein [Paraliomyxa miuraensis]|uniref:HPr family phosphocarrier protein n=1 Tax=Paraliomyxa miuraensis TaxID=376150 RepID=UPI002255FB06|nr:HPr family phosphocarrier protein [Paraliomyxa miuraensis]MCX4245458.1 HPr family phosphocarrier protein [Paraliomyxa miuraensis]